MTLVDKAALTAALAERDAARAEVARLRAAVEGDEMEDNAVGALMRSWGCDDSDEDAFDMAGRDFHTVIEVVRAALAATEDQP